MVVMPFQHPFDAVLSAALAGAPWAAQCLYEELRRPVASYVRLRGATDPDDVTSETFLQVFRDLASFEGDAAAFRTWVLTIAHRRVLDDWRRRDRRPSEAPMPPDFDVPGGDVEEDVARRGGQGRVEALLARLPAVQREVVLLRVLGELTLEETATVLGRTVASVKAHQHRAMSALRGHLTEQGESPAPVPTITEPR